MATKRDSARPTDDDLEMLHIERLRSILVRMHLTQTVPECSRILREFSADDSIINGLSVDQQTAINCAARYLRALFQFFLEFDADLEDAEIDKTETESLTPLRHPRK